MEILKPGGAQDQLLRQTRAHHVALSMMADTKANMLLSVASVVIALSFGHVEEALFHWPATVLIAFSLLTIVLAAYAAMPKLDLDSGGRPRPNLKDPGFNLLFFGDFIRLTYGEFERGMEEVLNDDSRTYEAQVREIYDLGCFLSGKKYRYVRLAYISFITGLVGAALSLLAIVVLQ